MSDRQYDEFPPGASAWPANLSRRQFLELMTASFALAGLGACNRPPEKTIVPYVVPPDRELLDAAVYYATAMSWEGYARGLLALSHSGRPTKLEGNPAQPDSQGATDFLMQAAVLALYDPDRSRTPKHHGSPVAWDAFEDEWLSVHRALSHTHGAKLALLTEPTTSPSLIRGLHQLLDHFPQAKWYQHTPLNRYDHDGLQPDYDFEHADVVLSIDADFLFSHPSALRFTRAFTRRRRIEKARVNANRLYVFEPALSITGSMADHRVLVAPGRLAGLLRALDDLLQDKNPTVAMAEGEERVLKALATDLRHHAPNVLCLAGDHVAPEVQHWAAAVNARLGANGVTRHTLPAVRSDGDPRCAGDLVSLVADMTAGDVETLVVLGCNPAYAAPHDVGFAEAVKHVGRRIHFGSHEDETAALCDWHIPESHFLESWSDLRAYDGTASIVQPLIAPLYATKSAVEFTFFLSEPPGRSDYDIVRDTWRKAKGSPPDFETAWERWLNQGIVEATANQRKVPGVGSHSSDKGAAMPDTRDDANGMLTVVIRADPTIRDGRWANNGWLQELPKPNSQLVWDNPAHISPALAQRHGLKNGDVVTLQSDGASIDAPVWIGSAIAADCVIVHLGYGRTRAGRIGSGIGFDAYRLRSRHRPWSDQLRGLHATAKHIPLVSTHAHFSMEGRDIVRTVAAQTAGESKPDADPPPSLYPAVQYEGYRWAMAIDLGTCIGCSACVMACQAENNTPVVGKDQVARGREMHWIRVDRYDIGDPENPTVLHQPVPCMQCENAPCELVCPVAATVHSSEGLNDMVYNRCIGTRYCSNNCPYKVRRFNFLDYRAPRDSTLNLQKNPDVSVRDRGVMEKCTYCVQRINAARIIAERENRRIHDGEITTACQQACPAEAIVFGDLNDPDSIVRQRKSEPTHYALLRELNTRPRTTYLAKITNRNVAADQTREPNGATDRQASQAPIEVGTMSKGGERGYLVPPSAGPNGVSHA